MGEEDEMIEKEAALDPDDHPYLVIYYLGVARRTLECPKCGRGLRSYRYLYGSRHEGRNI